MSDASDLPEKDSRSSESGNGHDTDTPKQTRSRVVATTIDNGVITIRHGERELAAFDVTRVAPSLTEPGIARNLAAYGVSILLRQAAQDDDPDAAVAEMIGKLEQGLWQPGRRRAEHEPEPVIEALAQHLSKPLDFVTTTYLPRYCEHRGLGRSDGRPNFVAAKRELERHKDIAPLIAKIVQQRARRSPNQGATDLASLAG